MTTWGVFEHSETGDPQDIMYSIILLERWRGQVEFPELRDVVKEFNAIHHPNLILIEKRASGAPLFQELKRARLPVRAWLPSGARGAKSKVPRAYAAQVVFQQGAVWYMDRNWAPEVIAEAAAFPYGENDDFVDTITMATSFLRKMYWLDLKTDKLPEDDDEDFTEKKGRIGYG